LPTLQLLLLGALDLRTDDQPLPKPPALKSQSLLAYLATHRQQPQSRERLADLFWGDQPERKARSSLSTALWHIRRCFPDQEPVLSDPHSVQFDPACDLWLDVEAFESYVTREDTASLEAGLALYRGDFMEGFYDDWILDYRYRLESLFSGALARLMIRYEAGGEYEGALAAALKLANHDPLREDAHCVAMRAYYRLGQRSAALKQYRRCQAILREELGIEPTSATTGLYETILEGREPPVPEELAPGEISPAPATPPAVALTQPHVAHNLPAQLTSFIGRGRETAEVMQLLETTRLLTLTGPPGTGKTRLGLRVAAEVVDQFQDGVFFVDLAPIRDPVLVATTIAQVLGIGESGGQPLLDTVKHYLRHKHLLLLLDNFEQVVDASPLVGDLLSSSPGLKALVTSREALRVYGEQEYPVPPLTLPGLDQAEPVRSLSQYEAVELFAQRARAVRPDFTLTEDNAQAVAEICVRLDGLPLAIELAAARSIVLSPEMMRRRLDSRLGVLVAGPRDLPARQRTLRGTIDWSYDLLDPPEQTLFARLAVFQGGRTVEAVEAVCSHGLTVDVLAGLESLLNKNLLRQVSGAHEESRCVMLEMIHEYAWERLEASGEAEDLQRRHAEYFLALAERAAPEMRRIGHVYWSLRLSDEQDNLRTALAWSLGGGDAELGLRLAGALSDFWYYGGQSAEGLKWTQRALESAHAAPLAARARALNAAGRLSWDQGDYKNGQLYNRDALALYRAMGDEVGEAWALTHLSSHALASPGECKEGLKLCEEGLELFRKLGDKVGIGNALNTLGELARLDGDYERAGRAYQEVIDIAREEGTRLYEAISLANLSYVAYHQGNYEQAKAIVLEVMAVLCEELENTRYIPTGLAMLAGPVAVLENPERAAQLLGASEALRETLGVSLQAGDQFEIKRYLSAVQAQLDEAAFEAAWAKGRTMSFEQAVSYALEVGQLPPDTPS
jgi:predicted ATPase/DNA-binding SARP family transcriptional activator